MDTGGSIFVAVPAYRDPECFHTLRSLFTAAEQPERIRVGVVWQTAGKDVDGPCCPEELAGAVQVMVMPHTAARGPCLARSHAWGMVDPDRHKFLLSIDCHMRFAAQWDSGLIHCLSQCPSAKPILTGYPPDYGSSDAVPTRGGPVGLAAASGAASTGRDVRSCLLAASHFDGDGMLRTVGKQLASEHARPLPSLFWAAGFSFSSTLVTREVPYDPNLQYLFFGEEPSMAVRLYTHGWDFFTPGRSFLYHQWSRAGRHTFRELGADADAEAAARARVYSVLGMGGFAEADVGVYGRGTVRSLTQYEEYCGVSFSRQTIRDSARCGGQPPAAFARESADLVLALMAQRGLALGPSGISR